MNRKKSMSIMGALLAAAMMITSLPVTVSATDSRLTSIVSKVVTPGMTDTEKAQALTKYTAETYSYDYRYQRYTDLLNGHGGDCWANTDMVAQLCTTAGIKNTRHDSSLYSGGSGHINNVIYADGKYYLAEAGYTGNAPRSFSFSLIGTEPYAFYNGSLNRYYGFEKEVEIPSEINGQEVTSIGSKAFSTYQLTDFSKNNSKMCFNYWKWDFSCVEEVTIPSTVTSISSSAFSYSMLKSINWPESVPEINTNVFKGCENLTTVIIPETVTKISNAFDDCAKLTKITIRSMDCTFDETNGTAIPKNITIYGFGGSSAEAYAASNGNNFVDLDGNGHSHSYGSWSKNETGHWRVCSICGQATPVQEHTKDKGTVTIQPTYDTEGEISYSCSVCKYDMGTEPIPKLVPTVTVTDGGNVKSYLDLNAALAGCKSSTNDIVITLLDDAKVKTLTLPTKAASVTFDGEYALELDNTKLNIPVNTVFDVEFKSTDNKAVAVKVSAKKSLTFNKAASAFGVISGSSTSVLNINEDIAAAGIASFAGVNIAEGKSLTSSGKITSVAKLNGKLCLTNAKMPAAITKVGNAKLVLTDTEGAIAKVTVKDVETALTVCITDADNADGEPKVLESGRTILWAGGSIDFTEKVAIENKTSSDQRLDAFVYSKDIRAEYANAVTVSNEIIERNFPNTELAFKWMNDSSTNYTLTLNEDVSAKKLALPSKAASLTIKSDGEAKTLNLIKISAVSAKTPLVLNNVAVESTKPFSISAPKGLEIASFRSESISAIKGGAKYALSLGANELSYTDTKTGAKLSPAVSGFGTVELNAPFTVGKTFTGSALILDEYAELTVPSGKTNVTFKTVKGENDSKIKLDEGFAPLKFTGTGADAVTGRILLVSDSAIDESTVIFASKNIGDNVFDVNGIAPVGTVDYTLAVIKGKTYLRPISLEVGENRYALWTDAVAAIEMKNDSTASYTIKLLSDHNIGGTMKLPKLGTYDRIAITSENRTLTFTGSSVSLTGNTDIISTTLTSKTSAGKLSKYTISARDYELTVKDCDLGLGSVSGKGNITLNGTAAAAVKAGRLDLEGENRFTGTISAAELYSAEGAAIKIPYLKSGSIAVTKTGIPDDSAVIALTVTDADGNAVAMKEKDVIASSFKGIYNNKLVLDEANGSFNIVQVKTKLVLAGKSMTVEEMAAFVDAVGAELNFDDEETDDFDENYFEDDSDASDDDEDDFSEEASEEDDFYEDEAFEDTETDDTI